MARKLRMYEAAWIKLKTDLEVRLATAPRFHARIRKAMYKEKDLDVGFKLQMAEADKKMRMNVEFDKKNENVIIFKLVPEGIRLGDL